MTTSTDSQRHDPAMPAADRVRQIAVPPAARASSTLSRIDYADAFLVDPGPDRGLTVEGWARAIFEDASPSMRRQLHWGWRALGLKLAGDRSDRFVLGWEIRLSTPDVALLGAGSRLGLAGELLFMRRSDTLLFATFVQLRNPMARVVWAAVTPRHQQVVRHLLERWSGPQYRS